MSEHFVAKKRLALLTSIITTIAIILCIILLAIPRNVSSGGENPPPQETPQDSREPKGPLLTVPENIFGPIGAISALIIAFTVYAISKKSITIKLP